MKNKYKLEDKRKLTEIKKIFNLEKFNKILNSNESGSLFDVLKKISKIDISFFDGFTNTMGLTKFFNKISSQLVYEPIIAFYYDDFPNLSNHLEIGLLKCNIDKKNIFQYHLINLDWYSTGIPQGDLNYENLFKLNENVENKKLVELINNKIKQYSKYSKIPAQEVYLFKKLNWSKSKIKKCIRNSDVKFI